jgi:hypothetical protein
LALNKGAFYSYAPIIRIAPGAEYKRKGLSPNYGIIMLKGLIAIGANNGQVSLQYEDIFCQDRAGHQCTPLQVGL